MGEASQRGCKAREYNAAGFGNFSDILTASNFSGKGPTPVGQQLGLGPLGDLRHGRQREGTVLDGVGRQPLHSGRRVE